MLTLGEVFTANKRRFDMARQTMAPAVGGPPGTAPLGDRPGTSSVIAVDSWQGTAAGRARIFAIGAFLFFAFVHVAAEARFSGGV